MIIQSNPKIKEFNSSIILLVSISILITPKLYSQNATISISPIATTVAGNSITINWTVTNTGTSSRSFGVGAEIRQNNTVLQDLGGETTPTISPNGTATGMFFFNIPTNWNGTYTARAAVWDGTPGSSNRLNSFDKDFTVQAQMKNATISFRNIGTVVAGNQITINYTVTNTGNYTCSFGIGTEIRQGGNLLATVGNTTIPAISPNGTFNGSFNYTIPSTWNSGTYGARAVVWDGIPGSSNNLGYYDRNFTVQARVTNATISVGSIGTVTTGNPITIIYTVTNTGNYTRTFSVGSEIRQGTSSIATVGDKTTPSISPNGTSSGSFNYTIPSNWGSGAYIARAAVWDGVPGSSNNLDYDDQTFTVQTQIKILGRIAFERTSDPLHLHAPNSDDGNIFIIDLATKSVKNVTANLGIGNCLNPNFSPDGSSLTFMAIPIGQSLSWDNMNVYTLDLARDNALLPLGNGQDPKFSPDGKKIVYKSDNEVYVMNTDGSTKQRLSPYNYPPIRSGPNYSPVIGDGRIVYWSKFDNKNPPEGDITLRLVNGTEQTLVQGTSTQYCYYPIWYDSDHILFVISQSGDDLYKYTISKSLPTPLTGLNSTSDDSDPFPAGEYIGFSSDRVENSGGKYDLYLGNLDGSEHQEITAASTSLDELGGTFSPYSNANELNVLNPTKDAHFTNSETLLLIVQAYLNKGIWSGSNPKVVFEGPINTEFTNLHDDGQNGDQVSGDGIYSTLITLPSQSGIYSIYASAISTDNGLSHEIQSLPIYITLSEQVPSIPTATAATNITNTGFTVNWNSVNNATGYRLDVSTSNNFDSFVSGYQNLDVGGATNKNVTGLAGGTTYYYRVRAYNSGGTSSNSNVITAATIVNSPSATAATYITNTGFTANWNSVNNATGYRLDISTSNTFSSYVSGYQDLDVGGAINKNVTGLSGSTTYYYRVRAYNSGGTSSNSNVITAAIIVNPPSAPTATAATNITNTGFTATWNIVNNATGYRLDISTSNTFGSYINGYQNLDAGGISNKSITGLAGGTTYYYRVRAYNSGGTSSNSNVITAATIVNPPSAPTANVATNISNIGFTANWNSVNNAIGYRMDLSTENTFSNYISAYQNLDIGGVTSKNVIGLAGGTAYYYRVRAYNSGGTSTNSNIIKAKTIVNPPSTPTATAATNITNTEFTANWNSVNNATGYCLDVSTDNSFSSYASGYQNLDVGGITSKNVTGLTGGTTYYYRVRAYNSGGTSDNSGQISIITVPPSPTLSLPFDGAINIQINPTLSWKISNGALFYNLQISIDSNFTILFYDSSKITTTSQLIYNLSVKTKYYWRVSATNNGGESHYSKFWHFTTITPTSVEQINSGIPTQYYLYQNYPNPFNPTTTIEFTIPKRNQISLIIYNILGTAIKVLVNEYLEPGYYRIKWSPCHRR